MNILDYMYLTEDGEEEFKKKKAAEQVGQKKTKESMNMLDYLNLTENDYNEFLDKQARVDKAEQKAEAERKIELAKIPVDPYKGVQDNRSGFMGGFLDSLERNNDPAAFAAKQTAQAMQNQVGAAPRLEVMPNGQMGPGELYKEGYGALGNQDLSEDNRAALIQQRDMIMSQDPTVQKIGLKMFEEGQAPRTAKERYSNISWDEETGKMMAFDTYLGKSIAVEGAAKGNAKFKTQIENTLRDDFESKTKGFNGVKGAISNIRKALKDKQGGYTASGAMAVMYSVMKILDEGAVVTKSDSAQMEQMGSFLEMASAKLNQLGAGGAAIPQSVIADLVKQAEAMFAPKQAEYDEMYSTYKQRAIDTGVRWDQVVPRNRAKPPKAAVSPRIPAAQRAFDNAVKEYADNPTPANQKKMEDTGAVLGKLKGE